MNPVSIIEANYIDEFRIKLQFDNGESGIVDLKEHLDGEIFAPLNNKEYFKNFKLDEWTIFWENGADFAPEYLYELCKSQPGALAGET